MSWTLRRPMPTRVAERNRRSVLTRLDRMQPWDHFARELDRCRRFGRALTLLRVRSSPGIQLDEAIVRRIESGLRSIDLAWLDGDALCLMLPETDSDAGAPVRGRVLETGRERGLELEVRSASFPDDGITAGALLDVLTSRNAGEARSRVAATEIPEAATSLTAEDS